MNYTKNTLFPLLAFKDNYIWALLQESTRTAWVVDPGEAAPVIQTLTKQGYGLEGILITHHHFDHTNGVEELLQYWKKTQVIGAHQSPIPFITQRVGEGDTVQVGESSFTVLAIPGHTLDHLAYYGNQNLFCGDTLFSVGCGRVFEGTPSQMYHSLLKLRQLPNETRVFCGHEYTAANLQFASQVEPQNPHILAKIKQVHALRTSGEPTLPSLLEEEKQCNPFLRCDEASVKLAVSRHGGQPLEDPVAVFTHLREWKNRF